MSTSFIDHATSYVNRAKKEAAKQAEEKAKKVQSAEELKKELQELQNLKRAIDDVVKADIEAMKKLATSEQELIDQKINKLCEKNSEFFEKAQKTTIEVRKKSLHGVGKSIKWFKGAMKTIGEELELDD